MQSAVTENTDPLFFQTRGDQRGMQGTFVRLLDVASGSRHGQHETRRLQTVAEFAQKTEKTGYNKVTYGLHPCGRLHTSDVGLQILSKEHRRPLCHKSDIDVDIKNTHPVMLARILDFEGIECFPTLKEYINNRSSFLELTKDPSNPEDSRRRFAEDVKLRSQENMLQLELQFSKECNEAVDALLALDKYEELKRRGEQRAQELFDSGEELHECKGDDDVFAAA